MVFHRRRLRVEGLPQFAAAATGFAGAGDTVSGATGWWGLRAHRAALLGGADFPAIDITDFNTNTFNATINIKGTGAGAGFIDESAITSFDAAHGSGAGSIIEVIKIYDQVGSNHFIPPGLPNGSPQLLLPASSGLSHSCMYTNTSGNCALVSTNTAITSALPVTVSAVVYAETGGVETFFAGITGSNFIDALVGSIYNLSTLTASPAFSRNTWYAQQSIFDTGTASDCNMNGVPTTGSTGTTGFSGATFRVGSDPFGTASKQVRFMEFGVWLGTAFSGANSSAMSANQRSSTSGWNF